MGASKDRMDASRRSLLKSTGLAAAAVVTPELFAGDEDTGSMAAWYVLSSLGFYQLCPAKPEYVLGAPLFAKATVKLPGGKTLVVENRYQGGRTVRTSLNGKALTGMVPHAEIVAGGTLRFA